MERPARTQLTAPSTYTSLAIGGVPSVPGSIAVHPPTIGFARLPYGKAWALHPVMVALMLATLPTHTLSLKGDTRTLAYGRQRLSGYDVGTGEPRWRWRVTGM